MDEVVTGTVTEGSFERMVIHDPTNGENIEVLIDDRTRYAWAEALSVDQLREGARVRVGFNEAEGRRMAVEVWILEPGSGPPLSPERLRPHHH